MPPIDRSSLRAGMRIAVGVSGGADSVALLRALHEAAAEIGLVLLVAHVHHGIRGEAADEDARFVQVLAASLGLDHRQHNIDTPASAAANGQTLEEAARELRYAWFRSLLGEGWADAVATAHTLDDQAETVLHRLLRGAWTEGLGGIHPVVRCPRGLILRPFLSARRTQIEAWLHSLGQPWREDATNADTAFTRNRIRHELLPALAPFNPRISEHLANLALIARDEESWWQAEIARLLPSLLLPGRPVRGGGRSVPTHPGEAEAGIELERLRSLAPALRRRILRAAAEQLGSPLNFEQTERLMAVVTPEGPRREQFTAEFRAERTPRELRLQRGSASQPAAPAAPAATFSLPVPGEVSGLGVRLRASLRAEAESVDHSPALLRTPRPGDRVTLRHSRGPRPLKEIFERMQLDAEARKSWPVLSWSGRIVWMQGAVVEEDPAVLFEQVED